jgi:hypothetical protein
MCPTYKVLNIAGDNACGKRKVGAIIPEFIAASRRNPVRTPAEDQHEKISATARHFIPRIPALHPFRAALQAFKNAVLHFCLRLSGK